MVFLSSLPEKYVGKQIEMDCVDIEIHRFEDNQPPIFKGPGVIRGDKAGWLSYKVYNQIQVNEDIFTYLKQIREENDPKKTNLRLSAIGYDGMKWSGGCSIPALNIFQVPYLLVEGKFDQLGARIEKIEGDEPRIPPNWSFQITLTCHLPGRSRYRVSMEKKLYQIVGGETITTSLLMTL